MRDLGYVEGKDFVFENRSAAGKPDRIAGLVTDVLNLNPDVLVLPNVLAIRTAKDMTKTIPILMLSNVDPVATGIIDSLARPGGNVTGLTRLTRDLSGKRLELLKDILPTMSRIGVFWNMESESSTIAFQEYEMVARGLGVQLLSLGFRNANIDLDELRQSASKHPRSKSASQFLRMCWRGRTA